MGAGRQPTLSPIAPTCSRALRADPFGTLLLSLDVNEEVLGLGLPLECVRSFSPRRVDVASLPQPLDDPEAEITV